MFSSSVNQPGIPGTLHYRSIQLGLCQCPRHGQPGHPLETIQSLPTAFTASLADQKMIKSTSQLRRYEKTHVQSELQNASKWFKIFKVIKGKWDGESFLKSCEILWIKIIMLVLSHGNIEPRAPRLACVLVFDLLRFILKNKMCDKTWYK